VKRKQKRNRKSLIAKMASAGDCPGDRQLIAKYGHVDMHIARIERWQQVAQYGKLKFDQIPQKELLFDFLAREYLSLNDRFFDGVARAIRAYKKTEPALPRMLKLSDVKLWVGPDGKFRESTISEIQDFIAPCKVDKRTIAKLDLPRRKQRGAPKKNKALKGP